MATITINIGAVDTTRVLDAVATNYSYQELIPNPDFDPGLPVGSGNLAEIDNPQTKGQFATEVVKNFLKDVVRTAEKRAASRTAIDALDTDIDIT